MLKAMGGGTNLEPIYYNLHLLIMHPVITVLH
jgi:hypothetical protein